LPSETAIAEATISAPTVTAVSLPTNTPEGRLSQPGNYEGYSQPLYHERTSSSQYIPMRDGTKLAASSSVRSGWKDGEHSLAGDLDTHPLSSREDIGVAMAPNFIEVWLCCSLCGCTRQRGFIWNFSRAILARRNKRRL
jgi:hypothetical protein